MANKNRIRITYPSSEKIYIPGKIHKINVGMRKIKILDTVTRDENGELVHKTRVKDELSKLLYERTRRSPMILPIIMEI